MITGERSELQGRYTLAPRMVPSRTGIATSRSNNNASAIGAPLYTSTTLLRGRTTIVFRYEGALHTLDRWDGQGLTRCKDAHHRLWSHLSCCLLEGFCCAGMLDQ